MLKLVLSPDTAELAALRTAIRGWAGERGVPEWPLTLIATELAANAMAVTPSDGTIEVQLEDRSDGIRITVADPGPGFDATIDLDAMPQPPVSGPRGRGLYIVQQLSSDLQARRLGDRTVVSASQPLWPGDEPDHDGRAGWRAG